MSIGQRLREERNKRGLKGRTVARMACVATSYVSRIENDQYTPKYETLERIATVLGLDALELIREAGYFSPEEFKSRDYRSVQIKEADLVGWRETLQHAQSSHQGGSANASRGMLEDKFEEMYFKIHGYYKICARDVLEEAVRLLTDVFVNLGFDYNVLLTRENLLMRSAPYRQCVEEILTLVPAAVDPMAQASFDYGVAETYHVLQEHELAIAYARKVLAVEDHLLQMFAQRLVIMDTCDTDYSNIDTEIAIGRDMIARNGEDSQLREGIAYGLARKHDDACWAELRMVKEAGAAGQPIIFSISHRTEMIANNIFYPGDYEKQYHSGRKLIESSMLLQLEKYRQQAMEIGKVGGIEFLIDKENNVSYRKMN
jgi:transcriptional regulator with XRE-family HTH domain